ncbi:hypothetical protein PCASD_02791 [Puccinia coronata f. sp. avenae]|uniref:Uncharacterized protein n=1 Tax=Puccinia coronata f. sp. avenae TaxID=200324 RepID=A0A2N5VG49_9BASI|nr:hypothetical protein PCASD_23118 [Puccinia coronata f. sp. avenae]PLW48876.1 hypothetical protein PCASD_02791 [Puccinia coronata f. sp. avenae]
MVASPSDSRSLDSPTYQNPIDNLRLMSCAIGVSGPMVKGLRQQLPVLIIVEFSSSLDGHRGIMSSTCTRGVDDIQHTFKMKIYCNNGTAILIAGDNASKKKTRYLIRAFYFINNFVRANNIKIQWTSTSHQQADILTKKLGPNKMEEAIKKLGLGG